MASNIFHGECPSCNKPFWVKIKNDLSVISEKEVAEVREKLKKEIDLIDKETPLSDDMKRDLDIVVDSIFDEEEASSLIKTLKK